jgi:signal transduction histidine kinase
MPSRVRNQKADAQGDALQSAVLRMTEDQMLVNQALVEKIFACERSQASLREYEQKLHELLAHQRARRDAERKELSREIHDSLAQNLLALRMDIVSLYQHTGERHARLHRRVSAALENLDLTLHTVKHLLSELRPAGFDLGVQSTVEIEARRFSLASGIACTVQVAGDLDALVTGEDKLMSVYRVLQEALNNVFRHSLASRVRVTLVHADATLELTIDDNGIGFDLAAPPKASSFGLSIQREQVAALGGTLEVISERTHGTRITLRLPVDA